MATNPGDGAPNSQAALLLKKQLAELNKNPVEGFSAGLIDDNDIFRWEVLKRISALWEWGCERDTG